MLRSWLYIMLSKFSCNKFDPPSLSYVVTSFSLAAVNGIFRLPPLFITEYIGTAPFMHACQSAANSLVVVVMSFHFHRAFFDACCWHTNACMRGGVRLQFPGIHHERFWGRKKKWKSFFYPSVSNGLLYEQKRKRFNFVSMTKLLYKICA